MSRALQRELSATAVAGHDALPCPTGQPDDLRHAALALERTAARARATATVRGALGPRLRAVWTGDAATAAGAEAVELGRRARSVVEALPAAAHSLLAYAAALADAQRRVLCLQRQWDALDVDHALAVLRAANLPDPTGLIAPAHRLRADEERLTGRVRLSRAYQGVIEELTLAGARSSRRIAAATEATVPPAIAVTPATVRSAVTGGLWFADGVVSARASRDRAVVDARLVRRLGAASATSAGGTREPLTDADAGALAARVRAHGDDPVYAQALIDEVGTEGIQRLVMQAAAPASAVRHDTMRGLVATMGSLLVTATRHAAPAALDPRTRAQVASGAALVADELVAGAARTIRDASGQHRAAGYWMLGQLLAGARVSGDSRPLPRRLVRRLAAATATAEIAETRDVDAELRHGTTMRPHGEATFATWLEPADFGGDALHLLLQEVEDDPAEHAALLAEPLPDSAVAGGALANARGDRVTLGEHLVRRWITYEGNGTQTHPDLRLETDDDLTRLLPSISAASSVEAAETRARLMLELSRTSAYAMGEASATRIYSRGPGAVEQQVVTWLSAMHATIDRALDQPLFGSAVGYTAETASGPQPRLDAGELTGVVAALAVDSGTGLHARAPAATYDRLVDTQIARTRRSASVGGDASPDIVRLGFFDQAASAALVHVARRQDELNGSAWQGLAEAAHAAVEIRRGGPVGLASMVRTYFQGGTLRTPEDDLAIAMVRSDVELEQTELNDERRAALVARIEALVGCGSSGVDSAVTKGAGKAPDLPTAQVLRQAREDDIRAAWNAVRDSRATDRAAKGRQSGAPGHTIAHVAAGRNGRIPELDRLPRGRNSTTKVVDSELELRELSESLTRGASRLDPGSYPGQRWLRDDGVEVRLRETSTSGGATIELGFPDRSWRKVHIR